MAEQQLHLYPNTFQVHNSYVDDCLHLLDGNELKVLLYTIRLIVGFNKRVDHISLSQFEHGRTTEDGSKRLDHGTGLSRETIVRALGELKKYGLIVEIATSEKAKRKLGACYTLQFDGLKVDVAGLEKRFNDRLEQNRKNTDKARKQKQSVQQTKVVCLTDQGSLPNRPILVCSTDTQNPVETQKENIHVEPSFDGDSLAEKIPKEANQLNQQKAGEKQPTETSTKPKTKPRNKGNFKPAPEYAEQVNQIFEFWKTEMRHPQAILSPERGSLIQRRLQEGYSVEQIQHGILGCKSSPHHMGNSPQSNPTNTVYDDLTLICRNSSKLDEFIGRYISSRPKQKPPTTTPTANPAKPQPRGSLAKMDAIDAQRQQAKTEGSK